MAGNGMGKMIILILARHLAASRTSVRHGPRFSHVGAWQWHQIRSRYHPLTLMVSSAATHMPCLLRAFVDQLAPIHPPGIRQRIELLVPVSPDSHPEWLTGQIVGRRRPKGDDMLAIIVIVISKRDGTGPISVREFPLFRILPTLHGDVRYATTANLMMDEGGSPGV